MSLSRGKMNRGGQVAAPVRVQDTKTVSGADANLFLVAAAKGDCGSMLMFLEHGVEAAVVDKHRRNALHLAAMNGHKDAVHLLVSLRMPLNKQDKDGNTAMMLAAADGHGQVVNKLVLAKADVFVKNREGKSALHYAAGACSSGVVTGLLLKNSNGAFMADKKGNTPVSIAKARKPSPQKDYLVYLLENWYVPHKGDVANAFRSPAGLRENLTMSMDKYMVHDLLDIMSNCWLCK